MSPNLKQEITLGQALGWLLTIVTIVGGNLFAMYVNLAQLETRVDYIEIINEKYQKEQVEVLKEIKQEMKELRKEISDERSNNVD